MIPFTPRKQRTRQHVIADQSINHVERYIIDEGQVALRTIADYGIDLILMTFDEEGYTELGSVSLQVKASETLAEAGGYYVHDLDIRDYNLWKGEVLPVCLILYDAGRRRAYWIDLRELFRSPTWHGPKAGAKYVRIRVPKNSVFNRKAVARLRVSKNKARQEMRGA